LSAQTEAQKKIILKLKAQVFLTIFQKWKK